MDDTVISAALFFLHKNMNEKQTRSEIWMRSFLFKRGKSNLSEDMILHSYMVKLQE